MPVLTLQEAAPALLDAMDAFADPPLVSDQGDHGESGRLGLLFGSEKTGLTNEELSFCSLLLTVPMYAPEGRHLSMNLGQAAAVCLYELTRSGFEGSRTIPASELRGVTAQDRERVLAMLIKTMESSGYSRRFPANARPEVARQLASQLGMTSDQAATWMGFFRQMLRVLPGDVSAREGSDAD